MDIESIRGRITAAGLAWRGAFHPDEGDLAPLDIWTIVLVGFTGRDQWPGFAASVEANDRQADPLDRWSRRVIGDLALAMGAEACFPFGGPPFQPFLRWAQKAEPVRPSPLGILIHPDWGLWHSYRGALLFRDLMSLPPPDVRARPCDACEAKPCLLACPVDAFNASGYDDPACVGRLARDAGTDCMNGGCLARGACPVGEAHRYSPAQSYFYQSAFRDAQLRRLRPLR